MMEYVINERMFKKALLVLKISIFLISFPAFGRKFPVQHLEVENFRPIPDPKVEADFRDYLVDSAQESIYSVTFDQRADLDVGFTLLKKMGEAAQNRGVEVKFASSWGGRIFKDPLGLSSSYIEYLEEVVAPGKFEGIVAGGQPMIDRKWSATDGIHIKLLIIDRRIVLVTGRGHADEYQRNLDSAYVFKTDSPGVKGGVVTNAVDFFLGTNGIWERLKQENSRNFSKKEPPPTSFSHRLGSWFHYWSNPIAKMSTPKQIQEYWDTREARTGLLSTTPAQLNELQSLKDWAENPQTTSGEILKAQIVHNDFMNQMCRRLPRPADCPIDERKTFIKDSILKKSIALIDQAKSTVRLYTFATILSEGLKDSLIAAAQRGVDVQVFTNGKEAHAEAISDGIYNWVSTLFYVPFGPSVAVGWYAGLDVMSDLLNAGVKIHALKITDEYNFLHRKRLQVDDIVSFGSSNLTEASTTMQWEMNIFVQGDFVANWAEADFQSDILTYALPLDPEEIQIERNQTGMEQSLARKFSFIY